MLAYSLIASALVMLAAFSGKMATWRFVGPVIERNLHYLVSFAAGVLLMIAYALSGEIIEHSGSFQAGLPWIALGAVAVLVAFRFLPQFHHHHDPHDPLEPHTHSHIDVNRVLASDVVHNIGDGAVIAVSFAASPLIGVASTVSILIHEMLQEISQFFVLREAGVPVRKALLLNFAASSSILLGTFSAYFALERFEQLEVPLMGLAVGSYLIVVFHDLLPHAFHGAVSFRHIARHVAYFLVGACIMGVLAYSLPHAEVHSESDLMPHDAILES